MDFKDVTYLRIEHYSNHTEVKAAADILVEKYSETKQFIKARPKWVSSARKLIASLWVRDEDLFRFSTKKDYFSGANRKQVWLTPKTLKLFKLMLSLGWIVKVKAEIRPRNSKKVKGGLASIYQRQDSFKQLLNSLIKSDIQLDEEVPLVTITDENNQYMNLDEKYLQTESYQRTVTILNNHYELLKGSQIKDKKGNPLGNDILRYRRKFKIDMGNGGRFYSPFCVMPKKERLSITINDEPVGSLDFSQLHPTLILLLNKGAGKETNLFATGDIYHMPDYPHLPRQAHKKFINTILNAKSKEAAARSIATAEEYHDLIEDTPVFVTYSGKAKRLRNPVWPERPFATKKSRSLAASAEVYWSNDLTPRQSVRYFIERLAWLKNCFDFPRPFISRYVSKASSIFGKFDSRLTVAPLTNKWDAGTSICFNLKPNQ